MCGWTSHLLLQSQATLGVGCAVVLHACGGVVLCNGWMRRVGVVDAGNEKSNEADAMLG